MLTFDGLVALREQILDSFDNFLHNPIAYELARHFDFAKELTCLVGFSDFFFDNSKVVFIIAKLFSAFEGCLGLFRFRLSLRHEFELAVV
jgi:hypothetical protein